MADFDITVRCDGVKCGATETVIAGETHDALDQVEEHASWWVEERDGTKLWDEDARYRRCFCPRCTFGPAKMRIAAIKAHKTRAKKAREAEQALRALAKDDPKKRRRR